MAIYHLCIEAISRAKGRSATAAAAYRSGARIDDQLTGEIHDYRRKRGVVAAWVVAPKGADWALDRSTLWNAVEANETRVNAMVSREFRIALPDELSPAGRERLADRFARHLVETYGVAADIAMHEPSKAGDDRNHHAHIMTTTRVVSAEGFGRKLRELADMKLGAAEIKKLRATWSEMTNEVLAAEGHDARIDHRTLEEQGIEGPATKHLGPALTNFERRRKREAAGTGTGYEPGSIRARHNWDVIALRAEAINIEAELGRIDLELARQAEADRIERERQAAADEAWKAQWWEQEQAREQARRQAAAAAARAPQPAPAAQAPQVAPEPAPTPQKAPEPIQARAAPPAAPLAPIVEKEAAPPAARAPAPVQAAPVAQKVSEPAPAKAREPRPVGVLDTSNPNSLFPALGPKGAERSEESRFLIDLLDRAMRKSSTWKAGVRIWTRTYNRAETDFRRLQAWWEGLTAEHRHALVDWSKTPVPDPSSPRAPSAGQSPAGRKGGRDPTDSR
ncbi:MobQ family relaxase [Bosea sp. CRIB-10]|uniref:MobQ family relaxase n=1 Tax=Bosea sp. CRIB-10 TaxID=378404 RepID=UPI00086C1A2A|nr:MobQ family relaxase [Bosea sp. CRIB-10]ODT25834.1 MAG: hypothetical protein ABS54_08150 [Hyphomicrobium sp. SCN 65-11]